MKNELIQLFGVEAVVEDGIEWSHRMWRGLWDRFDPDGVRFDANLDRLADGMADRIVAGLRKGGAEAQQTVEIVEMLIDASATDPSVYDYLKAIVVQLMTEDRLMPTSLRLFARDVVAGRRQRSSRRGPPVDPRHRLRDFLLWFLVDQVSSCLGFGAYSGSEMMKRWTAVRIVAEALKREGEDISIDTIKKAYKSRAAH